MKKKIYLGGPMAGCDEAQLKGWRSIVKSELSELYDFLDPVDFESSMETPEDRRKLVEGDLDAIQQCDIFLGYFWKATTGTAMELVHASLDSKETWIIDPTKNPWTEYHATLMFEDLKSAVEALKKEATK